MPHAFLRVTAEFFCEYTEGEEEFKQYMYENSTLLETPMLASVAFGIMEKNGWELKNSVGVENYVVHTFYKK
jgi:hypothetical protein